MLFLQQVRALLLLLLPILTVGEPVPKQWRRPPGNVGATVDTTSGPVIGHPANNRTAVSEYLGIPYAKPPVGNLRFAAPQAFNSTVPFNASSYSPDCLAVPSKPIQFPYAYPAEPRIVALFTEQENSPQSEDCLTLNVWTKGKAKVAKAILVWIYGGRFDIGDTNTTFYQGQYIADMEDVVFVSLNYRINIFGFSGAPGETQNVGLLDQRLAIEWVRDNIAGFGGDPSKITIFGQSAGGVSVDFYSYAWTEDPIVHGLISQSGTALSFVPNTLSMTTTSFLNVSAAVGCGSSGSVAELACMRSVQFKTILNASVLVPFAPTAALPQPPFQPTVDNKTVFSNYTALSANGSFMKVPYLAGNTDYEAGFYKISAFTAKKNLTEAQWNLFNLEGFTCPTSFEAASRAKYSVPMWRYRYFGDFSNLRLYPGSGAYHGSEINMILGTAFDVTRENNTRAEVKTSRYMMHAWATFANDPLKGLSKLGWPQYDPNGMRAPFP